MFGYIFKVCIYFILRNEILGKKKKKGFKSKLYLFVILYIKSEQTIFIIAIKSCLESNGEMFSEG